MVVSDPEANQGETSASMNSSGQPGGEAGDDRWARPGRVRRKERSRIRSMGAHAREEEARPAKDHLVVELQHHDVRRHEQEDRDARAVSPRGRPGPRASPAPQAEGRSPPELAEDQEGNEVIRGVLVNEKARDESEEECRQEPGRLDEPDEEPEDEELEDGGEEDLVRNAAAREEPPGDGVEEKGEERGLPGYQLLADEKE